MKTFARWAMVPLAPAVSLLFVYFLAGFTIRMATAKCPRSELAGGICTTASHTTVMDSIIYVSVALCVLAFSALPALIAPRFKKVVALIGACAVPSFVGFVYVVSRGSDIGTLLLFAMVASLASAALVVKLVPYER